MKMKKITAMSMAALMAATMIPSVPAKIMQITQINNFTALKQKLESHRYNPHIGACLWNHQQSNLRFCFAE